MILNSIHLGKLLVVLSGASYLIGTVFLAASIRWQSEILPRNDHSDLAENVRRMGSPGYTDIFRFRIGVILSSLGYILLLISTLFNA
jgi:hypothetical protein